MGLGSNLGKVLFLDYNINMKEILTYKTAIGKCPFDDWFCKLDNDISELRFTFGSGYRIYFTEANDIIVILLCAGDKSKQTEDIKKAKKYLEDLIERNI